MIVKMNKVAEKILLMDRAGNINSAIHLAVKNYDEIKLVKDRLLRRISYYLRNFNHFITDETKELLKSLPEQELTFENIQDYLDKHTETGKPNPVGEIEFPVMSSIGMIRKIKVFERKKKLTNDNRLLMMDRIGKEVVHLIEKFTNRLIIWKPDHLYFEIIDPYGKHDPEVVGRSMELPLALAIYSFLTNSEISSDLTASACLDNDSSLKPVSQIEEKMDILVKERPFIKRILISGKQKVRTDLNGIKPIKANKLEDAISAIFQKPPDIVKLKTDLDIESEINSLRAQFNSYLIDTCIKNAGKLIKYLKSKKSQIPREKYIHALFTCYWKKGCAHCHRGKIRETETALKEARNLYKRYPGIIMGEEYYDSLISYAVLLKDIFRYSDAEKLHFDLMEEFKNSMVLDHTKGKNLSTLSQLYLALGRYSEAEKYQRNAMRLINKEEISRNYGYLAQIYTRSGNFRKAGLCLYHYQRLLIKASPPIESAYRPFYNWIRAEFLYKKGLLNKRERRRSFNELYKISEQYKDIIWWVPALINKFSGLALLAEGETQQGLKKLENAIQFFKKQHAPVLRVLCATIEAERALYYLKVNQNETFINGIKSIVQDLSLQKDVKRFFKDQLTTLNSLSRKRILNSEDKKHLFNTLNEIIQKIPY